MSLVHAPTGTKPSPYHQSRTSIFFKLADPHVTTILGGTLIAGRYRVTREIGRGGMAYVYQGEHVEIGKHVAIKVLAAEFTSSTVVVERFLREARAAAAVRSPYICDVYDSGKLDDERPFLVMELLEGESLYERMVRVRQFDAATTVRVITHVARGLTRAHASHIVHRDLKPENIFLTTHEDGDILAKILDFGLAKFYAPIAQNAGQVRLTREGAIFGTPAYMSPEQVKGQGAVDHRADVWAMGCITYECLTGRTVWSTDQGIAMTFAQIASAPLPKITHYRPDLPRSLEDWFQKALCREIDERFQTAKELAESLANALHQGPPSLILSPSETDTLEDAILQPPPWFAHPTQGTQDQTLLTPLPVLDQSHPLLARAPSSALASDQPFSSLNRTPSLAEMGTSNPVQDDPPMPQAPARPRGIHPAGILGIVLLLAAAGAVAWKFVWLRHSPAQAANQLVVVNSNAAASAPSVSSTPASAAALGGGAPALPSARWISQITAAQGQVLQGDLEGALKAFKEALDSSGASPARTLAEYVNVTLSNKGPCRLRALGRLRPLGLSTGAPGRPLVVSTSKGIVALWTDDHEAAGHDHAYAEVLDAALRPLHAPIDVTPETDDVGKLFAEVVNDRIMLVYGDTRGSGAGLYLRWLDADGRIVAPPVPVASARAATAIPSVARREQTLWLVWDEERDPKGTDLFARKLTENGPAGADLRLTDFAVGLGKVRAMNPQVSATDEGLELVFRLERDVNHPIVQMQLSTDEGALPSGLPASSHVSGGARADRSITPLHILTAERDRGDTPSMVCTHEGCFVAWHVEHVGASGGAVAAFVDLKSGQMLWRKKFASTGGRPSVFARLDGAAEISWYEQGRVRLATLSRDGVGPSSALVRVAGDQPRPSLTAEPNGTDWTLAWLDFEAGHLEPYALRATCPQTVSQ